ncbi:MAG: GNAT family N-acetyltransferase [Bacteriovoracia bacterium]
MKSSRLVLRRFARADLPFLLELETDSEVMKFTGFRVPQLRAKTEERLEKLLAATDDDLGVWGAESSGVLVGWFMLKMTEFAVPELGFMLPQRAWGKGYATEGSALLVKHGLARFPALRAVADAENLASIRVLEKAGFRCLEGNIFEISRAL